MFFELLFGLYDALDDDDDPDNYVRFVDELIMTVAKELGMNDYFADKTSVALRKGIINATLGIDMASRVGLDSMLWRAETDPEDTAFERIAKQLASLTPLTNIFGNIVEGGSMLHEAIWYKGGDPELAMKGVEKFLPNGAGDLFKPIRHGVYGQTTRAGNMVIPADEFQDFTGILSLMVEAGGFNTERMRDVYERRSIQFKENKYREKRRALLMDLAKFEMRRNDVVSDGTLTLIDRFNRDNPDMKIITSSITNSLKAQQAYEQQTVDGIRLQKKQEWRRDRRQYFGKDEKQD
ncbi:hypothetical protein ACFQMB_14295 [Pseudobowmanella zhangzhouensis]